jgi:glycerol uptake facilitator protein
VQDRGPAAYLAEFIGTLGLVFFITAAFSLFVTPPPALSDYSVLGLVHAFALFALVQTLAVVSGAHFNPAVTVAMAALRQIKVSDAAVYVVAQLAGAVAGALLTKALLTELANADLVNFGATTVGERVGGKTGLGMLAEFIGTFFLVFTIVGVGLNPRIDRALGPLAIGVTLGLAVMIMAPLTGAGFNPARSFGPALVADHFGGAGKFLLVYVAAPVVAAVVAAAAYFNMFIAPGKKGIDAIEPVG